MEQTKKLLVIEDDLNLTLALYRALSHTYKVYTSKTATSGIKKIQTLSIDLIILDLNLPDATGLKVIKNIRQLGYNMPVLVLSGEASLDSKVDLLDNGANDYLTKPFSLAELKARIRVLLRKDNPIPFRSVLVSPELILDPKTRQVIRNGKTIELRSKEFALLECLLRNAGSAISRAYLADYVWGEQDKMKTNSIDVHINSLRDKIDRDPNTRIIKTVHGLGYLLDTTKPLARIQ